MKQKVITKSLFIMMLVCGLYLNNNTKAEAYNYAPPEGFIKDKVLALKISELILKSVYGEDIIEQEKPLKISLANEVWIVHGTLRRGMKGGVAEIKISKRNGTILSVVHGK